MSIFLEISNNTPKYDPLTSISLQGLFLIFNRKNKGFLRKEDVQYLCFPNEMEFVDIIKQLVDNNS